MSQPTFFTSIGCMDGRIHNVIEEVGKKKFAALHADTITEPGFVGLLSREAMNEVFLKNFKHKLFISTMQHASKGIIVSAHADCAGNPVSDSQQKDEVLQSVDFIKEIVGDFPPVIGVFVKRDPVDPAKWIAEDVS